MAVEVSLVVIALAVLAKVDAPGHVRHWVRTVTGHDDAPPAREISPGTFARWVGGFTILAVILLTMEASEDYRALASALAVVIAFGVLAASLDDVLAMFGVSTPRGAAAPSAASEPPRRMGRPY
jgi:hypothetical protein